MNCATVDGGTGQFSLHSTICTSLFEVSLLHPPPSGGRIPTLVIEIYPQIQGLSHSLIRGND